MGNCGNRQKRQGDYRRQRRPGMSWEAACLPNGDRHVVPLEDWRPHEYDFDCWCHPEEDFDGTIVHRSIDRREEYESGRLRLS